MRSPIMNHSLISAIHIPPERQRTDIPDDHIGELMSEFSQPKIGLLNPIVIERQGDKEILLAGECRLRAVQLLYKLGGTLYHQGTAVPAGCIPSTTFDELTELQRMEIEYSENARRRDLTWQENAKALALLNALRAKQAELEGRQHTYKAVAEEVFKRGDGEFAGQVSDSVLVARHLDNPAVAKASSLKEAKKILVREDEKKRREVLAREVGLQSIGDRFKVYNANCLDWMREQPADQFDVILTDPPYGMNADEFGDAAGKMVGIDHQYKDDEVHMKALLSKAIPEFYRLAKPEAHLYLWCDIDYFLWLRERCAAAGWWVHRTPLINIKPSGGRVPWPEHGPRRSYELCLYAVKGKRRVTSIVLDTFESRLTEGNLGHGAQKPVEAYVDLLKRSTRPGDVVLDAFAGSGTIFPAAHMVGCSAVGVELSPHAYGICLERIKELK